ncbi:MAG TPA: aldehyde dehydrogenase family protein [Actinophytocola sp.]|uniref:aldehyde dehydrogenase family protein n=1 Tax=Actinophytocola sp. TaxID=1872138 RepID=UPI002DDCC2E7|nr:aldehyde dehydrogenase family protein [Actinophytocola sp.]HEV2781998.1 aldehyde dehydrogenase family protein [Actinophytocola sp.]
MAGLHVPEYAEWPRLLERVARLAPAAFSGDRLRNLHEGRWQDSGEPSVITSPVDQSTLGRLSKIDEPTALAAVAHAHEQHRDWSKAVLADRKARVLDAVDAMTAARDDLALLLAWEIGKPWKLACADVDRALDGVRWYVDNIDGMLATDADGRPYQRQPLSGPVSNIASWNYPMSVLVHAELVQLLAGNAVVAKTPTQGGAFCLTVAHALMHDAGLPVTLLSGDGSKLSSALVRSAEIGALAFVGGRDNGGKVAAQLVDTGKRHMLEQEGLNCWGIWDFSDWDSLAAQLRKGYEYAKQRCTAYPRFVVQRELVDTFLATYLPVVTSVRFGHPLAVADDGDPLPELAFGPLISAAKAAELRAKVDEALHHGAIPLYRGTLDNGRFLPGQDTSAYVAPNVLLAPPGASRLMHEEPFGPVDTIVVVDTKAELLAQMNASNGALVASIACDDVELATDLAEHVQAFKVGVNKPRSRGDRDEPFGGRGGSWKGAFVGGVHLVHAVTQGPADELLYGNFPNYSRYPEV